MVKKVKIRITPLDRETILHIYLPRGYRSGTKRYPVLYMYDGHNLFSDEDATYGKCWGIKDFLDARKAELIVVGVECDHEGNRRLGEYSPYSFRDSYWGKVTGRGKKFMEWMSGELKEYIDSHYRTMPEREHTGIAGSSMGGLMAVYSIGCHNDTYSRAGCVSPFLAYNFKRLFEDIKGSYADPTRVYLSWGAKESNSRVYLARDTNHNLQLANRFLAGGACVYLNQPLKGTHSEGSWEQELPVLFTFLYPELFDEADDIMKR